MDESLGKVQDVSTHHKRCCHGCCSLQSEPLRWNRHRRHRPASRESEVKLHRGDGWVRFGAKLTAPCHDTPPTVSIPLGRWMKVQGQLQRRAHIVSLISVNVGIGQRCRARVGVESPASLPTTRAHVTFQRGAGRNVTERSKNERTTVATFRYTLELINIALPPE